MKLIGPTETTTALTKVTFEPANNPNHHLSPSRIHIPLGRFTSSPELGFPEGNFGSLNTSDVSGVHISFCVREGRKEGFSGWRSLGYKPRRWWPGFLPCLHGTASCLARNRRARSLRRR